MPAHIMLLDIHLPGLSGLEVMKLPGLPKPNIYPVFAMTGHVDPDALEDFRCYS